MNVGGLIVGAVGAGEGVFEDGGVVAVFAQDFGGGLGAFAHEAVVVLLVDECLIQCFHGRPPHLPSLIPFHINFLLLTIPFQHPNHPATTPTDQNTVIKHLQINFRKVPGDKFIYLLIG